VGTSVGKHDIDATEFGAGLLHGAFDVGQLAHVRLDQ
jgi:hypothetical protein